MDRRLYVVPVARAIAESPNINGFVVPRIHSCREVDISRKKKGKSRDCVKKSTFYVVTRKTDTSIFVARPPNTTRCVGQFFDSKILAVGKV